MDENYLNKESLNSGRQSLTISDVAIVYLKETSKWAKFLAIMGFIATGLMVIFGFFSSTLMPLIYNQQIGMGMMPSSFSFIFTVVYIAIGLLYFFPSLYLFKFSTKTKEAIHSLNEQTLTEALQNQKSVYKFWGIFTIIILALYALMLVFGVLGALLV